MFGWRTLIPALAIGGAAVLAMGVGVFFGWYPRIGCARRPCSPRVRQPVGQLGVPPRFRASFRHDGSPTPGDPGRPMGTGCARAPGSVFFALPAPRGSWGPYPARRGLALGRSPASVSTPAPIPNPAQRSPPGKRRLERKTLAPPGADLNLAKHQASRFADGTHRIERAESPGDEIRVHEGAHASLAGEKLVREGGLPGAVRTGDDQDALWSSVRHWLGARQPYGSSAPASGGGAAIGSPVCGSTVGGSMMNGTSIS